MQMFGKGKDGMPDELRSPAPVQHFHSATPAPAAAAESGNGVSSISAGMTVVGKIAGSGAVKILGRVEGELHASTVLIADGAEVEGDVVAEELTVGGRVKGTIRANRVRLNGTAVVEGDISIARWRLKRTRALRAPRAATTMQQTSRVRRWFGRRPALTHCLRSPRSSSTARRRKRRWPHRPRVESRPDIAWRYPGEILLPDRT
jgi:cytoskeletal protein CcmA (bactofilin family)